MAGSIFFDSHNWPSSSSKLFYVFEYLADHVSDADTRARLRELVDENIPLLDLRDPQDSVLVDLIADSLPQHLQRLPDEEQRRNLSKAFEDLITFAQEQQSMNQEGKS
ncbi:hypothetical protein BH09ACT7_BH09ACT7_23900 [soil metagenome]